MRSKEHCGWPDLVHSGHLYDPVFASLSQVLVQRSAEAGDGEKAIQESALDLGVADLEIAGIDKRGVEIQRLVQAPHHCLERFSVVSQPLAGHVEEPASDQPLEQDDVVERQVPLQQRSSERLALPGALSLERPVE